MTYQEYIQQYAEQRETFSMQELWEWLQTCGITSRQTMQQVLAQMVERKKLIHVAKGVYAKQTGRVKQKFEATPTNKERRIYNLIHRKLPLLPLCVYNGTVLSPIQHHLSYNNTTYVETERFAVESVGHLLMEAGKETWIAPNEEIMYHYVDLKKGGVIVKPLITEAPIEIVDGIPSPTLEKLLVDIRKDPDFSYLHGMESVRMMEIARDLYHINPSRLRRYAKRRGINIDEEL